MEEKIKELVKKGYYELRQSSERPAILGYPELKQVPYFGLNMGDKVDQIGEPNKNGKETSSSRIDRFPYALTYSGIFQFDKPEEQWQEGKWLAFKVPDSKAQNAKDLFEPVGSLYLIYAIIDDKEIVTPLLESASIRIFKPKFKIVEQ